MQAMQALALLLPRLHLLRALLVLSCLLPGNRAPNTLMLPRAHFCRPSECACTAYCNSMALTLAKKHSVMAF